MLIGIDVGGTFTDGVLIDRSQVVRTAKVPTTPDLVLCLLEVLDAIIKGTSPEDIERIVLSTTLITNLIAEGKTDPAAAIIVPGPGVSPSIYSLPGKIYIASGGIDYRGREIERIEQGEILRIIHKIAQEGYRKVAVVGKFSPRNHSHEEQVAALIKREHPDWEIELGHLAAGQLNFPRRVVNTVMTVATKKTYQLFIEQIKLVLRERGIHAPVFILKADGGTLPVEQAANRPVETIFSGPAASTMGVLALTPPEQTSVVVDIGGTTTDLALILSGSPLLSSKGARVKGWLTQVRGFAVKSVPIGGDSCVRIEGERLLIGPERLGPAGCLGGRAPTPTDALRVLGLTEIGDAAAARTVLRKVADKLSLPVEGAAKRIIDRVVDQITAEINQMFLDWEKEPAYRIWELKQKERIRPENVVGVGGAAPNLVPLVARRLNCRGVIPAYAMSANAVGAAVARPTLTISLHADTERRRYSIAETGAAGKLPEDYRFSLEAAEKLAKEYLQEYADAMGVSEYVGEMEVVHSEVFNLVRDWHTVGRIYDVIVQISPGLIPEWRLGGVGSA